MIEFEKQWTKFLDSLSPEERKFITQTKLFKSTAKIFWVEALLWLSNQRELYTKEEKYIQAVPANILDKEVRGD